MSGEAINVLLSFAGIAVSAAGFCITLYQIKKTRSAVEAAESATRMAVKTVSARQTISELADMRSGLRAIQTALRGGRFETALIQTQAIVEQLHGLRGRTGFESDERHAAIQTIVVQLAKLRNRLEQKIAAPDVLMSVPNANNMLSEFGGTLSVWSEELRFSTEEERP